VSPAEVTKRTHQFHIQRDDQGNQLRYSDIVVWVEWPPVTDFKNDRRGCECKRKFLVTEESIDELHRRFFGAVIRRPSYQERLLCACVGRLIE